MSVDEPGDHEEVKDDKRDFVAKTQKKSGVTKSHERGDVGVVGKNVVEPIIEELSRKIAGAMAPGSDIKQNEPLFDPSSPYYSTLGSVSFSNLQRVPTLVNQFFQLNQLLSAFNDITSLIRLQQEDVKSIWTNSSASQNVR